MTEYTDAFYQHQMHGSLRSAQVVVPMVLELTEADSVIDVGCGVGTWLSVYRDHGVSDFLGLDGDYVDRKSLLVEAANFMVRDLAAPLNLGRKFALVQCLEVAEHIDPSRAEAFVSELTRLGDLILFSAAVPYQLGTGHVNERFIDYWVRLFRQHGFQPADAIRPAIWDNENVEVCYRQNILLFARPERIAENGKLASACHESRQQQLSIIHPDLYQPRIQRLLGNLTDLARTVQGNGNLQLALTVTRSVIDFDPRNSAAWDLYGQLAAQTNHMEQAITHFRRAIELDPENASHHFNLGRVYAACGLNAAAKNEYDTALRFRPGDTNIQQAIDQLGK